MDRRRHSAPGAALGADDGCGAIRAAELGCVFSRCSSCPGPASGSGKPGELPEVELGGGGRRRAPAETKVGKKAGVAVEAMSRPLVRVLA